MIHIEWDYMENMLNLEKDQLQDMDRGNGNSKKFWSFIKSKKSDILCTYQIFGALLLCVVCVLLADIWNYV